MSERSEMPARLRRINSHQVTHERAAAVIEELEAQLAAVVKITENWESYYSPIAEIRKCLKK